MRPQKLAERRVMVRRRRQLACPWGWKRPKHCRWPWCCCEGLLVHGVLVWLHGGLHLAGSPSQFPQEPKGADGVGHVVRDQEGTTQHPLVPVALPFLRDRDQASPSTFTQLCA